LKRTDLPLHPQIKQKGNERTDKVKPKKVKGSVLAVKRMSKKKARKLLRAHQREQRTRERIASAMEV
uniref:40S ribosomal protein S6 n=1 Tax=Anisakis simplex TaxID=6269 RepID=A0A0M3JLR8_ANISI